ncbi:RNA 2'-phosphotransferase [Aliikangiella sp. IMCC44359]|uniref:RNA 2'-phosphotransferase n=1 Tax=Aliikangiella sp. IMCC44359 TaxID=3459125 RepID=UPI00403A9D19
MKDKTKRISKFLSYVLRHNPAEIDLELDDNGWVSIKQLIENANSKGKGLTMDIIKHVVETNDKQRFAMSENGQMIRASQGHSINVDLELESLTPPDILLHGSAEKSLGIIMASGIKKMNRHHVHLSEKITTASEVGKRYGKLVLLEIDAKKMHKDGFEFYKSDNNVWLVDYVPAKYIQVIK